MVRFRAVGAMVAVAAIAGCGGSSSSSSTSTTSTGTSTGSSSSGGANGKQLFTSNGCSGCHTLKAAGSTGTTGPNLDTQLPNDAKTAGKDLKAFVEESIVKPNAYIAKGFSANIMPQSFGQSLSKADLQALVSFITGGR